MRPSLKGWMNPSSQEVWERPKILLVKENCRESQNGAFANAKQMKHCLDEKCNPSPSKIPVSNMPLKKKNETYQLMKNLILSKFKMESVLFITPFLQRLTCIQGKPRRGLNCCLSWKSWEISPSGKLLS